MAPRRKKPAKPVKTKSSTKRKAKGAAESKAAAPAKKKPSRKRKAKAPEQPAKRKEKTSPPAPATESSRRERVIFPMATYQDNKDAIKAPFKSLGMKWQYLGPGRGRYAREGAQAFATFTDEHADFTLQGEAKAVETILAAWEPYREKGFTKEAVAKIEEEALSEEVRAWEIGKPVRQPGEPSGFYERRLAEWKKRDPRKARG